MSKKSNNLLNQLERELQDLPDELFIDEEGKWKDLKKKGYFKQNSLSLAMMSENVDADTFDIGMEENNSEGENNDGDDLEVRGYLDGRGRKKKSWRGKTSFVPRGRGGRVSRGARGSNFRKFIPERGGRGGRGRDRFDSRSRYDEHRRESRTNRTNERDDHHFTRRQTHSGSRREEYSNTRHDENKRYVSKEGKSIEISSSTQDERPGPEGQRFSHEADLMSLFDQLNVQLGIEGKRPISPEVRRVIIENDKRTREESAERVPEEKRGRWDVRTSLSTGRLSVERSKTPPRSEMNSSSKEEFLERELSPGMLSRLRDLSPDLRERFIQEITKKSQTSYQRYDQSHEGTNESPHGAWGRDSPESHGHFDKEPRNRSNSPERSRFNDGLRNRERSPRQESPRARAHFEQSSRKREISPKIDFEKSRDHSPKAWSRFDENSRFKEQRNNSPDPRFDQMSKASSSGTRQQFDQSPRRSNVEQEWKSRNISPKFVNSNRDTEFPPEGSKTPPQRSVSPASKVYKDQTDSRNSEFRGRHRVQSPTRDKKFSSRDYGNRSPSQPSGSFEKRYKDYHGHRKRTNSRDSPISLSDSPDDTSKWKKNPLNEFQQRRGPSQPPPSQSQTSDQPSYTQAGYIPPPGATNVPVFGAPGYPPPVFGQFPGYSNNSFSYPPPNFAQQDYTASSWAATTTVDGSQPITVPPLSGLPPAKSAEETKKEAIEKEQKQQKQTLLKQREEYVRKSASLNHEMELLRNQKRELLEEKSSDNDHILKENQKLQTEIQNKLKAIANVIDMLTGIIGDKESDGKKSSGSTDSKPKSSPQSQSTAQKKSIAKSLDNPPPPGVGNEPIQKIPLEIPLQPRDTAPTSAPSTSEVTDKAVFNYVHYDPEMHWCRVCNVFPKTAKEYLNHLHSSEHKTETVEKKLIDMPWHQTQKNEEPVPPKGAPTKRVPIRGLQFFISATAWYCKLCNTWIGDLHCASNHLKSTLHSQKYSAFAQQNPHWEVDWLADRSHAYEHASEDARRMKRIEQSNKQPAPSSKETQNLGQKEVKSQSSGSSVSKTLSEQLLAALKARNTKSSRSRKKSSSSGSSSSNESNEGKKHSIRVAMRNKNNVPPKAQNRDEKKVEAPKVKSKWDSPEREIFKGREKAIVVPSTDDRMLQEWMEVPDKDRDMINNLKDRLKHKQQEIDREIEKRRAMEKIKYMKESRERRRDSRWDGRNRRDSEKDSRSSRRSDRSPEKQKEKKTRNSKEHDSSEKQSSKNVKASEGAAGKSSGKLEKPTGGRQIWVPGSDDSDLEENVQSNFEKQVTESAAKKKDSQTFQKTAQKPKLPFIGRMPFIGKLPVTKQRKSEDSAVEDVKKDEKSKEPDSSKKDGDKSVLIWPDIPKVSDNSNVPKDTAKNTSNVKSNTSTITTQPAVTPKSTLLLSKLKPGLVTTMRKKKNKRKTSDIAGGVEDMDLDDDDDDNDEAGKRHLPKDFQDALDILFPSGNPEEQPIGSEAPNIETLQTVSEITVPPALLGQAPGHIDPGRMGPPIVLGPPGSIPLGVPEPLIPPRPMDSRMGPPGPMEGVIGSHGPMDVMIRPQVPMDGRMGPPGPMDNRMGHPVPMRPLGPMDGRMGPPGPMDGRMGPPGPMDGRMGPPGPIDGRMGPPGPIDGRMGPMDGRMGPPGPMDERMGPHGPMDGRMGPPGPMDGRMGPPGPMDGRMGPPGPMDGRMGPPGPIDGRMRPPGPIDIGMRPPGPMGVRMRPPGPMDVRMGPGPMRPPGPLEPMGPRAPMGGRMGPHGPMGPPGPHEMISEEMNPRGPMGFTMGPPENMGYNDDFGPGMDFDGGEYGPEGSICSSSESSDGQFKKKNPPSQKKRLQMKKRREELTAKEIQLKKKISEQSELLAQREKNKKKAEMDELAMLGIDSDDMAAQAF